MRADAGLKSDIDRVIACGRGERFDERGYLLGKGGFVSVRSVELGKEADKVQGKIAAAFKNRDPEVRDQFVTDLLARGGLYARFWERQSGGFIGIDEAAE